MKSILFLFIVLFFMGCQNKEDISQDRWYVPSQALLGEKIYNNNCISCHLKNGQGSPNWKTRLSNGSYPPPPLNGDAHTWHHSFKSLKNTIEQGSLKSGGIMPGFRDTLSQEEITSVMAYFQDKWDARIYKAWMRISGIKNKDTQ